MSAKPTEGPVSAAQYHNAKQKFFRKFIGIYKPLYYDITIFCVTLNLTGLGLSKRKGRNRSKGEGI